MILFSALRRAILRPSPRYAGMIPDPSATGWAAMASPRYAGMILISKDLYDQVQTSPRYAGMILMAFARPKSSDSSPRYAGMIPGFSPLCGDDPYFERSL